MAKHLARARIPALAILIVVLLGFAFPIPVKAQGIAISGNFYRQHFELIPGQSITTPEIYVVVFNHGENDLRVKLTTHAPLGVELILPTTDFILPPGENRQLEVGVNVGLQVPPGEYDLILTAEAFREGEGIKLAGAAQQQAKLTIIAEAGEVEISAMSPQGEPFPATIRLYKQIEGQNYPCGYSETGSLKTKLTPGGYLVEAYYQGAKVAQESFSLAVDERKIITLVPQTIYIEGFAVVRNWHSQTGEFAFAKIVYTINNMYQPLKDATAVLRVSFENKLVDEIELISLPTLDVGKTGGSGYNYIPSQGWQHGTYIFRIELYSQGKLYAQSTEVEISAEPAKVAEPAEAGAPTPPASTNSPGGGLNWTLLAGIIGGVVLVIVLIVVLARRRSRY